MRELESSRMNFLRQGRAGFTYRTMFFITFGWILILVAAYGAQFLYGMGIEKEIAEARVKLDALTAEKDAQIKALEAIGRDSVGSTAKEDLAAVLMTRPNWSRVLRQLTRSLPPNLWLQSIRVVSRQEGDARLDISGKAKAHRQITNYIMTLESSGLFRKTELLQTKKPSENEPELEFDIVTIPILSKF